MGTALTQGFTISLYELFCIAASATESVSQGEGRDNEERLRRSRNPLGFRHRSETWSDRRPGSSWITVVQSGGSSTGVGVRYRSGRNGISNGTARASEWTARDKAEQVMSDQR